ncbi:SulP family inorganic anion transporter [Piscinibacter terrae]|nr:SulP family inorganic anion transporter [Albitalea terrae]
MKTMRNELQHLIGTDHELHARNWSPSRLRPWVRWQLSVWGGDLHAGWVSALLMLPQAVALAAIAGLPPEAGIYASIFPVIAACLLGASQRLLSGPNTAVAVMTASAITPFATPNSEEFVKLAWSLAAIVGILQVLGSALGAATLLARLPRFVTHGLTLGVGLVIIATQVPVALSLLSVPGEAPWLAPWYAVVNIDRANPSSIAVVLTALLVGAVSSRLRWRVLSPLVASLIGGTLMAVALEFVFGRDACALERIGHVQLVLLPLSSPAMDWDQLYIVRQLLQSAVAIAIVGGLQTAIIAQSITPSRSDPPPDPARDLFAQGVANMVASVTSGFAGSGSFNRSAAHVSAGATSRVAGVLSALILFAIATAASDALAHISVPAMAGTLILIGWRLARSALEEAGRSLAALGLAAWVVAAGLESAVLAALVLYVCSLVRGDRSEPRT